MEFAALNLHIRGENPTRYFSKRGNFNFAKKRNFYFAPKILKEQLIYQTVFSNISIVHFILLHKCKIQND